MTDAIRYFVVDIETDGPEPGRCSMLNLSMVVTDEHVNEIDSFSINFQSLAEASGDPETIEWWKSQPNAWEKITENAVPAHEGMMQFANFVRSHNARRIFVGHPLVFDGFWVGHYMQVYLGQGLMAFHGVANPLFFGAGIDLPSYVAGSLDIDYALCRHGKYPEEIATNISHTHFGLDDARGHADVFRKTMMLRQKLQC